MSARLSLAGADAYSTEWKFAPDELEPVEIEMQDDPVFVRRGDVPGMLTSRLFVTAWQEWIRFRDFGLAHGRGPNGERPIYIRALQVLQQEFAGHQSAEIRNRNGGC